MEVHPSMLTSMYEVNGIKKSVRREQVSMYVRSSTVITSETLFCSSSNAPCISNG
jgi:hypothetical protein